MNKINQQLQFVNVETLGQANLNDALCQAAFITPDALMSYCQTRLRGIDDQVQSAFAKQERDNSDSQVLSGLASGIQLPTEDPVDLSNNNGLASVGNEGAQDYINDLANKFEQAANTVTDPTTKNALEQAALNLRDKVANGAKLDASTLKSMTTDAVGKFQQDLNSGAELSMINLQSLMSQRQQAVQVCTNLVQSLGDQCNKVAENVGH